MSKSIISLLGLLIVLSVVSCVETPLPPEDVDDPVFFAKGLVDGQTVEMNAGDDGYFLSTRFLQNAEGVYVFRSELLADNKSGLSIFIQDKQSRSQAAAVIPEEAFSEGNYRFRFRDSVLEGYNVEFVSEAPAASQVLWTLNNGVRSTDAVVNKFYPTSETDSFTVVLRITTGRNCLSFLQERIEIPKPDCYTEFSYESSPLSGRTLQFSVAPNIATNSLLWNFNGSPVRGGRQVNYTFPSRGVFQACVEQDNCKAQRCKNVISGNADGCPVNFTYTTTPVYKVDTVGLGEVMVAWTDANGRIFSTRNQAQNQDSRFVLSNRSDYEVNDQGDATQQMNLDIRCWVYNGNDSLLLELNEVHWAFAFPE